MRLLLPACLVLALLAAATPAAAAPVQGRVAFADPGRLTSGDGAVLHERADGFFVAARSADGSFRVEVERRGGKLIGAGVVLNGSESVVYHTGATSFYRNGEPWAPARNIPYPVPGGGTIEFTLDGTVVTSAAGDRASWNGDGAVMPQLQVEAGTGRQDGELEGLLGRWDSDARPEGDFAAHAVQLATWRRSLGETTFAFAALDEQVTDFCGRSLALVGRAPRWAPATGPGEVGRLTMDDPDIPAGGEMLLGGGAGVPITVGGCRPEQHHFIRRFSSAWGSVQVDRTYMFDVHREHAGLRYVTLLRNTGSEPVTVPVRQRFATSGAAPLDVLATSSGDAVATAADNWMVVRRQGTDKPVTFVWSGTDARRSRGAARVGDGAAASFASGGTQPVIDFGAVTLPAGGVATFVVQQQLGGDTGLAEALAGGAPALERLTPEERDGVVNYYAADADPDLDGVGVADDVCPGVEDPRQEDTDGDGVGDACSADDDGDGASDADEQARGTDPKASDTDGDRRGDGDDRCPLESGYDAVGCALLKDVRFALDPVAPVVVPQLRAADAPARVAPDALRLTVGPQRRRGRTVLVARGRLVLPAGTTPQTCTPGVVELRLSSGPTRRRPAPAELLGDCSFSLTLARPRVGTLRARAVFLGNDRLSPIAGPRVTVGS